MKGIWETVLAGEKQGGGKSRVRRKIEPVQYPQGRETSC